MPAEPRYRAFCEFDLPERTAQNLGNVIRPETDEKHPRTRTELGVAGGSLTLKITTDNLSGLRAALNSHLRWIDCACEVHRLPEEGM